MRTKLDNGYYWIYCPGCKSEHLIHTDRWSFNGDYALPTFNPSLLVRCGHYVPNQPQPPNCHHCAEERDICGVCHSFIREGNIQFLDDCTHELAGKTVPLPEVTF